MRSLSSLFAKIFAKRLPILDHLSFSTCCFNFLLSGLGEALCLNCQGLGQFTIAEDANTIKNILENACFNQSCRINNSAVVKAVELFNIYFCILLSERPFFQAQQIDPEQQGNR